MSAIWLLGKPLSEASLTFAPPNSCSPEKATIALYGLLLSCKVVADRVEILDRPLDAARHDHGPCLAADLVEGQHLLVEVVHHDLGLEADGVLVALDVAAEFLPRPLHVELGITLDSLDQPVIAVDRRVVLRTSRMKPS